MAKKLGHTKGGSHRRKKIDKLKMRNYYAKDLQNFTPKVIQDKRIRISEAKMLREQGYDDVFGKTTWEWM